MAYTDAAAVAAALRLAPDTTLATAAASGATILNLTGKLTADQTPIYPGMTLALDQFAPVVREVVTVTGAVTGSGPYAVPVSSLANAHVAGSPVKEASRFSDVIDAASGMVDAICQQTAGAFAAQSWTETVWAQVQDDGRLHCFVTGRNVTAFTSYAWSLDDGISGTVDPSLLLWRDFEVWARPLTAAGVSPSATQATSTLPTWAYRKQIPVTVTYTAGYASMPADIAQSAAILAARLFKEGDAGFSDITGNPQTGTFSFGRAVPKHVEVMLLPRRRWG